MALQGKIGTIQLSDIFQMLAMSIKEQTLTVARADERKTFFFTPSGVTVYFFGGLRAVHMGAILVNLGKISEHDLAAAQKAQEAEGRSLAALLLERSAVTQDDIDLAVTRQIEEEMYELLAWEEGEFQVTDGPPTDEATKDPENVIQLTFDVTGLLMEAARRIDELESLSEYVASMDDVYRWCEGASPGTIHCDASWQQRLCQLIDRRLTLRRIVEDLKVSRYDATVFVAQLVKDGAIEPLDVATLHQLATQAFAAGHVDDGLKLAERVVRLKGEDLESRAKLAAIYEKLDEKPKAAYHLMEAARVATERGDPEPAADYLEKALVLQRENQAIRERLMACHLARGDSRKAFRIGAELLVAYLAARSDKADAHVRALMEMETARDDAAGQLRVIELLVQYRRLDEAQECLATTREVLLAHDAERVTRLCREILRLDPSRGEVVRVLQQGQKGHIDVILRRRRREAIVTGLVIAASLALGIYFLWRTLATGL